MRTYLPHLLTERRLAWSSCHQAAAGLTCFSTKTLGWDILPLALPPRTGRSQLPQGLRLEACQRLCTRTTNPRHRVLLMPTSAAGRRVSAGVRLQLTDSDSARMLIRVEQGKGRKDRSTLLSPRLLTALRASGQRYRPAPWFLTGRDPQRPMPSGPAQKISSHAQRTAGITHGHGILTLRPWVATHLLDAGGDVRTSQRLRGPQSLDTTTRSLRITRPSLATIRSPFALLPCGDLPRPTPESPHGAACH
jgi:integrase/recombinase XerD